jgi:hypothetical protein
MKKSIISLVIGGFFLLSMCVGTNNTHETTVFAATKLSSGNTTTDKNLQKKFSVIAKATVQALKSKDFKKLAALANSKNGIAFSSGCYLVNGEYAKLSGKQLLEYSKGKNKALKFIWGVNGGSGESINLNFNDFHKQYLSTPDFLGKNITVSYGDIQNVGSDPTNYLEKFPKSTAVMYYYPGTTKNGNMDWKAMILVYQQEGKKIVLSAVLHGEFTP